MKKVRSSQAAILVLNGYWTISPGQLPPEQLPLDGWPLENCFELSETEFFPWLNSEN